MTVTGPVGQFLVLVPQPLGMSVGYVYVYVPVVEHDVRALHREAEMEVKELSSAVLALQAEETHETTPLAWAPQKAEGVGVAVARNDDKQEL